ncbi:MAG: S4 domain-containing protein [Nocardioidaceae bacterium]
MTRLDAELVRRGLARSREHASALITADRVKIGPVIAVKAATAVGTDQPITVIAAPEGEDYVSRGGHKLAGALAAFRPQGLVVEGKVALDAGCLNRWIHRRTAAQRRFAGVRR